MGTIQGGATAHSIDVCATRGQSRSGREGPPEQIGDASCSLIKRNRNANNAKRPYS